MVHRIGPQAGRYYRAGPAAGRWTGCGAGALGLSGPVDHDALDTLLLAKDPATGSDLLRRRTPHRRAGWDLVFAAPKSVSLLVGLAPPTRAEELEAAHRAATEDAIGWLEGRACWARRQGLLVGTDGLVAARFDHRRAASGDPHLHTHLLVVNAARAGDGRWSALDGSSLWTHRAALGAVYHLALRHHLELAGVAGGWRLTADGSFDLAAVPRGVVRTASRREAEIRASLASDEPSRAARRAARALTRVPGPEDWWAAVGTAGLGPAEAAGLRRSGGMARQAADRPAPDPGAVSAWLATRRSTYSQRDVLVAVAAVTPSGMPVAAAEAWAQDFVRGSQASADGRVTTPVAAALDRAAQIQALALPSSAGRASSDAVTTALGRRPALPPAAIAAVTRLTAGTGGVVVLEPLPPPATTPLPTAAAAPGTPSPPDCRVDPLVGQAAVLDAAREAWETTGYTVVVRSTAAGGRRWAALAGLAAGGEHSAGTGLSGGGGRAASVLVVDRADRLSPVELRDVLQAAARTPAKVVLVRGGTLPPRARACSEAFEALAAQAAVSPAVPIDRPTAAGPVAMGGPVPALSTNGALDRLVQEWWGNGGPGVLVGLGPAEVAELNRRARQRLRSAGELTGPEIVLAGRPFAVGDRVIPLRRDAGVARSEGHVIAVEGGGLVVRWADRRRRVDAWEGRHLGHAYALTPAGLRLRGGPAMLLGRPDDLGRDARHVVFALSAGIPDRQLRRDTPRPALALGADRAPGPKREPARDSPGLGL